MSESIIRLGSQFWRDSRGHDAVSWTSRREEAWRFSSSEIAEGVISHWTERRAVILFNLYQDGPEQERDRSGKLLTKTQPKRNEKGEIMRTNSGNTIMETVPVMLPVRHPDLVIEYI